MKPRCSPPGHISFSEAVIIEMVLRYVDDLLVFLDVETFQIIFVLLTVYIAISHLLKETVFGTSPPCTDSLTANRSKPFQKSLTPKCSSICHLNYQQTSVMFQMREQKTQKRLGHNVFQVIICECKGISIHRFFNRQSAKNKALILNESYLRPPNP